MSRMRRPLHESLATNRMGTGCRRCLPGALAACLLLGAIGCQRESDGEPAASATAPATAAAARESAAAAEALSAEEVLERTVKRYQQASAYRDQGLLRLTYTEDGLRQSDQSPLAVHWQRPNRLLLQAYLAVVASDGRQLRARIMDEPTAEVDGQVLVRPAPAELTLNDVYADPLVHEVIRNSAGRYPIQLELLLSPEPIAEFRRPDVVRQRLASRELEGRLCHRIEIRTDEGPFVLWIDQSDYLVRRLEYPAQALEAELQSIAPVQDVRLMAELRGARFDERLPEETFSLALPDGATPVSRFVTPPQPLPSELFGERPGPFHFTSLDGQRVPQQSLDGQLSVLVWIADHPACRLALEQLERVWHVERQQPVTGAPVRFYAVATEPRELLSDQRLGQLLDDWSITVPVVRDLEAFGRDLFQIPFAPTLVVLDAQGRVQIYEVGANPRLGEHLPIVLERLRAGDDLAQEIVDLHSQELQDYQRALREAQR